jgi:hypothetical protein
MARRTDGWLTVRSLVDGGTELHVAVDRNGVRNAVSLMHDKVRDQFIVRHRIERPDGTSSMHDEAFGRDIRAARRAYGVLAKSIQITG